MKNKKSVGANSVRPLIITLLIITILIYLIPKAYSTNTVASISVKETEQGKEFYVDMNLKNITYTNYILTLKSSVYLEPSILDINTTTLNNKEFKIDTIPENTESFSIKYPVPEYITAGTIIQIDVVIENKDNTDEKVTEKIEVKVVSNKQEDSIQNQEAKEQQNNNAQVQNSSSNSSSANRISNSNAIVATDTAIYNGSRNNYLESIIVNGYDLNPIYNKTNDTYFITVSSGTTSIDVSATKETSSASLKISGNNNLKQGLNKVLLSVEAENGNIRYYRIYVNVL